jgi:hypothetical protein
MEIVLKYFGVLMPINHEVEKPTWVTQSSANIGDVLDHLKLGLDDGTTPDSLTFMVLEPSLFICISPNLPVTLVSLKYFRV